MAQEAEEYLKYLEDKYRILSHYNSFTVDALKIDDNLARTVSNVLQNMKQIILKRNESRILEDGNFQKWNKLLYFEVIKIKDAISIECIEKFIEKTLSSNKLNDYAEIIENKLKSNLKQKIIYRHKQNRRSTRLRAKVNADIKKEWDKLLAEVPLKILVIYVLNITKSL